VGRKSVDHFYDSFSFAGIVLLLRSAIHVPEIFRRAKAQRRKGAKKTPSKRGSALRLCAFARENFSAKDFLCKAMVRNSLTGGQFSIQTVSVIILSDSILPILNLV
jgi:hypothetical protein